MDNITLAIEILTRAETEKQRLAEYEKEYAEATTADMRLKQDINGIDFEMVWEKRREVYNKYKPVPKKTQINSSIKYARKLLAESYK